MAEAQSNAVDTGQQHLGTVYAKALLGATEQAGTSEQVLEELDSFVSEVLDQLPKFENALISPRVPNDAKASMLDNAFQGKMNAHLLNFLKVISNHGRMNCIRAIRKAVRGQFNELRGRVEVTLRTAAPLDVDLERAATARLQQVLGGEVDLATEVDESLIGGAVIRVGDTVFDASVVNRLKRMRKAALDATTQTIRHELDRFAKDS